MRLPEQGAIEPGIIQRIESFGAFCKLSRYPHVRGLIHISQLATTRIEQVQDVVSIDDTVWVKVLQLEKQENSRLKVSLSMKDASQDGSGTDLAAQEEQKALAASTLETSLNSRIGMGIARDPMANPQQQRLRLKHSKDLSISFNGYSLVGDDAGEPEHDEQVTAAATAAKSSTKRLAPVGRGRGATLPAWMTQQQNGPTGVDGDGDDSSVNSTKRQNRKDQDYKMDNHSKRDKRHGKSHKKEKKYSRESNRDKKRSTRHRQREKTSSKYAADNGDGENDSVSDDNHSRSRHRDRNRRRSRDSSEHRHHQKHSSSKHERKRRKGHDSESDDSSRRRRHRRRRSSSSISSEDIRSAVCTSRHERKERKQSRTHIRRSRSQSRSRSRGDNKERRRSHRKEKCDSRTKDEHSSDDEEKDKSKTYHRGDRISKSHRQKREKHMHSPQRRHEL